MKTLYSLAFLILLTTGCRVITFSQTHPSGSETKVSVWQAFTATGSYRCVLSETNATVEAVKSGIDNKALGTAVGAAVKAAMKP